MGEESVIDPVEFGEIKGAVAAMRDRVSAMEVKQGLMDQKLDLVLDKLSAAQGGWRALMMLGGAGATLGSFLTWFFTHSISVLPKP